MTFTFPTSQQSLLSAAISIVNCPLKVNAISRIQKAPIDNLQSDFTFLGAHRILGDIMRSYEAARRQFSFLEGIAVLAKIGGVILAFIMVSMAAELIERSPNPFPIVFAAAVPGVVLFLMGSFFQAQVQANRASVDSAEYAQQSLKIARDQFAFSKQVHAQTMGVPVETYASFQADETLTDISFDTDKPEVPAAPVEPRSTALEVIEHNGVQIEKLEDGYRIENQVFVNLAAAKKAAENPEHRQLMAIHTEPA